MNKSVTNINGKLLVVTCEFEKFTYSGLSWLMSCIATANAAFNLCLTSQFTGSYSWFQS